MTPVAFVVNKKSDTIRRKANGPRLRREPAPPGSTARLVSSTGAGRADLHQLGGEIWLGRETARDPELLGTP